MNKVVPFLTKHIATRGAGISADNPHEGATYPYPMLITLAGQEAREVRNLAQVIHRHYDDYKDADPGGIGWALERQITQWSVPYHEGAVAYLREVGFWSEADERHNQRLLKRQQVLSEAWQAHVSAAKGQAEFVPRW